MKVETGFVIVWTTTIRALKLLEIGEQKVPHGHWLLCFMIKFHKLDPYRSVRPFHVMVWSEIRAVFDESFAVELSRLKTDSFDWFLVQTYVAFLLYSVDFVHLLGLSFFTNLHLSRFGF
jgi:hypothetical protein